MSDGIKYVLELGVSEDPNVEEIDEFLQEILLDLYDQEDVERVRVTRESRGGATSDENLEKMIDIINRIDSEDIRKAIDSVRELENIGDDDDDG